MLISTSNKKAKLKEQRS